jgi:hypothetical protein
MMHVSCPKERCVPMNVVAKRKKCEVKEGCESNSEENAKVPIIYKRRNWKRRNDSVVEMMRGRVKGSKMSPGELMKVYMSTVP